VQLAVSVLLLELEPALLREVPLDGCPDKAQVLDYGRNLDFLSQLVEAAVEESVFRGFLAAADPAALRQHVLDVELERAEETLVHFLKLADVRLLVQSFR